MKNKELDLLIVVNMFLTGFDATTLNTLRVDKNLKMHGLIQAYSRTNRILNSIKVFGNIVCFRNLQKRTDDAISLFGDKEAGGIVLMRGYKDYYFGYEDVDGKYHPGYQDMIEELTTKFPLTEERITGEQRQKEFIVLFGAILRMRNLLTSFDEFAGSEILSERDFQDYGDDSLWLAIEEYRNQNTIAIRYEKTETDGVVWDTDYVMNFNDMKMSVRLDRSYLESALTVESGFSTPHFISLLVEKGYIKDDNNLPVSNRPVIIDKDNLDILVDVINGVSHYRLPVVYISKTFFGEDPVNVKWIASRLKGVAHVLVQKEGWLNSRLRRDCDDKNEYYGAIGIYYPNQAVGHKRFLYRAYEGSDDILMERVIRSVIQYSNSQMVDTLYTWSGVNNALLRDRYSSQKEERLAAELEKAKALNDADELIAYFDDDIKKLQQQVEQLTKANDALSYENQGLKAKLDSTEDVAIIYLGVEDEFFPGEIKEMILEAVAEKLKNTAAKTRRYDVLADIIQRNGFEGASEKRANTIKILLRDYRTMSGTLRQALMDLGFTITEDGKHYRLTYYGDGRYKTTVSKTASDHREGKNIASTIIKNMF